MASGPARGRQLVAVTGVVAALPVMAAVVRGLLDDWVPIGDQAITATRAYDVFTEEIPLVGVWSTASLIAGEPLFHPGPLLYWIMALPARMPGDAAFLLAMGALNVAAVMWIVSLAHRRGGRPLMFATAAAIVLLLASLPTGALREIWNPSAPLLAFTLLLFLCWSLACGDYRLLPAAILLASFVMQCHLVFLLPCLAALGTGISLLALTRGSGGPRCRTDRQRPIAAALVAGGPGHRRARLERTPVGPSAGLGGFRRCPRESGRHRGVRGSARGHDRPAGWGLRGCSRNGPPALVAAPSPGPADEGFRGHH